MNIQDFIKTINKLRLDSKISKYSSEWYAWTGIVEGKNVSLKGYKTWLQRLTVNNIEHGAGADLTTKEFKTVLEEAIAYNLS